MTRTRIRCAACSHWQEKSAWPEPAAELLPEITEDDVHLACWIAIVPAVL
jgi:hypothetical protein